MNLRYQIYIQSDDLSKLDFIQINFDNLLWIYLPIEKLIYFLCKEERLLNFVKNPISEYFQLHIIIKNSNNLEKIIINNSKKQY